LHSEEGGASCRDLVKLYWTESERIEALKGISARFRAGVITAVMGPSGSGKSSLLRILAAIDRPTSGEVEIAGVNITRLSKRKRRELRRTMAGYVFQRPADNFVSYLTVGEHLEQWQAGTKQSRLDELLDALGLAERRNHYPHELSGGELQRAAFAQVLAIAPAVVVADEPTAELDGASSAELLDAMRSMTRLGTGFIVATHDRGVADAAHDVIELHEGTIASVRTDDAVWSR
jgi:putative ABC transport system ATP-binding protein